MIYLIRSIVLLLVLAGAFAVLARVLRRLYPVAWTTWVRRSLILMWGAAVVSSAVWNIGRVALVDVLAQLGATGSSILFVSGMALLLFLPLWGPAALLLLQGSEATVDDGRRAFLRRAAGVAPAAALVTGPAGAIGAGSAPRLRRFDVHSAHVPPQLDGVTLLHLSDIHLGAFIDVTQVTAIVEAVRATPPDLVLLTGDIADDYALLPPALAALRALPARLGHFCSIGNHEIFRGREEAVALFREGGFSYLCDDGVVLSLPGDDPAARMWLAGADDPGSLGGDHRPFLAGSVARAFAACPNDIRCRVLMSHRPEGFDAAQRQSATLTLSGHTHGGQMAVFGRSIWHWAFPKSYLLGRFQQGNSHLYTTAGLGHWFPLRLNCPCEASLITLRSARAGPSAV